MEMEKLYRNIQKHVLDDPSSLGGQQRFMV
jgi:hypothetical protein